MQGNEKQFVVPMTGMKTNYCIRGSTQEAEEVAQPHVQYGPPSRNQCVV